MSQVYVINRSHVLEGPEVTLYKVVCQSYLKHSQQPAKGAPHTSLFKQK